MKKLTLLLIMLIAMPAMALAVQEPVSGDFAYDLYDVAVNDILRGPVGFVGGMGAILLGAISAIRAQIMLAVPAILGGAFMLKADSIVSSLGALIF